jgi:hypothetical protein
MITRTFEILKYKKDALIDSIKKFNKKARKLNVAPMEPVFGEERVHSFYTNEAAEVMGILTKIPYIEVTVSYEIPKLNGWELVSVFDYEAYVDEQDQRHKAVFTSTVPGKELPFEYQDKEDIGCEHCGHRRYRVKSFLVQHESGEYKEVGSTCLKDFLGHDPSSFIYYCGIQDKLADWEEEYSERSGSREEYAYDLSGVLALTSAVIKKYGWVSRSEAYEANGAVTATADNVSYFLHTPDEKIDPKDRIEIEDEDREIAAKTLEYFTSLEKQDNDYIMNCLRVIKIDRVTDKRLGIACSMIQVYRRHVEKEIEKANELPSEWFGNVGNRLEDCEVLCTFKTHCDTMYGMSTLYKFMDNDGNIFKTFYSGHTWSVEQEEKVKLWGTVKKHDEWNGKKETLLTRCKVAEIN